MQNFENFKVWVASMYTNGCPLSIMMHMPTIGLRAKPESLKAMAEALDSTISYCKISGTVKTKSGGQIHLENTRCYKILQNNVVCIPSEHFEQTILAPGDEVTMTPISRQEYEELFMTPITKKIFEMAGFNEADDAVKMFKKYDSETIIEVLDGLASGKSFEHVCDSFEIDRVAAEASWGTLLASSLWMDDNPQNKPAKLIFVKFSGLRGDSQGDVHELKDWPMLTLHAYVEGQEIYNFFTSVPYPNECDSTVEGGKNRYKYGFVIAGAKNIAAANIKQITPEEFRESVEALRDQPGFRDDLLTLVK